MRKVDKEFLMDLVKVEYDLIVKGLEIYKKNLDDNMKTIKYLETLGILPKFAYNEVYKVKERKIAESNYKLTTYEVDKNLLSSLVNKGYDTKLVEKSVNRALENIDYLYTVKKNKIEMQTYNVWSTIFNKVMQFEIKEKIEKTAKIFRLDINIQEMYKIGFNLGLTTINEKYDVKLFKNGKLQIIEK